MRHKHWAFRIEHILTAIQKIQTWIQGMDYTQFKADDKTVDAVLQNLLIIGEAVRGIPDEIQRVHPEVPWALMRGMRNVLVHEYERVRLDVVWKTLQDDVPPLKPALQKILAEIVE